MSFEQFTRKDHMRRDYAPKVSIRKGTLAFNASLKEKAKLEQYSYVTIFVDEDSYRLGFRFHNNENDPNSLKMYSDGTTKSSRVVSAAQLLNRYPWLKITSELESPTEKRFKAFWDNIENFWITTLRPCFEHKVKDRSQLGDTQGIYQYKREGEIVYIGRGKIKTRIDSPERVGWEFDTIEYSTIDDLEKQARWERYWLGKFKTQHGCLPLYNKIEAPSI